MQPNEIKVVFNKENVSRRLVGEVAKRIRDMINEAKFEEEAEARIIFSSDVKPSIEDLHRLNNFTSQLASKPLTLVQHLKWIESWLYMDLTRYITGVTHFSPAFVEIGVNTTDGTAYFTIAAARPNRGIQEPIEYIYSFGPVRQLADTTIKHGLLDLKALRQKNYTHIRGLNMTQQQQYQELMDQTTSVSLRTAIEFNQGMEGLYLEALRAQTPGFPEGVELTGCEFMFDTSGQGRHFINHHVEVAIDVSSAVIEGTTAKLYVTAMYTKDVRQPEVEKKAAPEVVPYSLKRAAHCGVANLNLSSILQRLYNSDPGFAEWRARGFPAKSLATNLVSQFNKFENENIRLALVDSGIVNNMLVMSLEVVNLQTTEVEMMHAVVTVGSRTKR